MARGKHAKRKPPPPRHALPPPPPQRNTLASLELAFSQHTNKTEPRVGKTDARAIFHLGGVEERCADCSEVLADKFDTSLMCSLGHMTCFACVAAEVQPHPICSAHCNGFKFKCAECNTWSCVSKTQELAMLCGRHSIALDRLHKQRILRDDFERPRICTCRDSTSDDDTPSSEDSEEDDEEETERAQTEAHRIAWTSDEAVMQLPRICHVDFGFGHAAREQRLARLRRSLLGCNRVVGR